MNRTDRNALDDDEFRHQFRAWIAANYHSPLRDPLGRGDNAALAGATA